MNVLTSWGQVLSQCMYQIIILYLIYTDLTICHLYLSDAQKETPRKKVWLRLFLQTTHTHDMPVETGGGEHEVKWNKDVGFEGRDLLDLGRRGGAEAGSLVQSGQVVGEKMAKQVEPNSVKS